MNSTIYKLRYLLLAFCISFATLQTQAQAVVSSATCSSLGALNSTVSLKTATGTPLTSVQTGLDFNLIIEVPGGLCTGGHYSITINTTDNLILGNPNPNYIFANTGINQFTNSTFIPADNGIGFNVPFRFRPGITCQGALGQLNVTIKLTCGDGSVRTCVLSPVSLTAVAQNYWKVEKKHVWGDLRGGTIIWDVILTNNHSPRGIGDYDIPAGVTIHDNFPGGQIVQVVDLFGNGGFSGNLTGLGSPLAAWQAGYISSTSNPVVYRVTTTSCQPAGTLLTNCVDMYGPLGFRPTAIFPPACAFINGVATHICDTVRLVSGATASAAFSKTLTYGSPPGSTLNYAPGCEAEYTIRVSNNGNMPLNNLILSDVFPTTGANSIHVTQVTVSDNQSGANMAYSMTGLGIPTGPLNTSTLQSWTSGTMSNFTLTTAPTSLLLQGYIEVKIRFTIANTASYPNWISNCAKLTYSGSINGSGSGGGSLCGVPIPNTPPTPATDACVKFQVQAPKAIPGIHKCISNGRQSFSLNETIPFRIVISNHGGAAFSGNVTDNLALNQNLALVAGSVSYSYGTGPFSPYSTSPGCDTSGLIHSLPSWLQVTQQTSQNLGWAINNMPFDCDLDRASYLVIDFNATILPQSFGNYHNSATLSTPGTTLGSDAYYNILRSVEISTTKAESTTWVEPGQSFNYIIVAKNEGSIALKNIRIEDVLPPCVTYKSSVAQKIDNNSVSTSITSTSTNVYTFPGLILQPGESVEFTITVARNADDKTAECCNEKAIGRGTTNDAILEEIASQAPKVCVKSALCCDINNVIVNLDGSNSLPGIVPLLTINSGPLPIQEIEVTLTDYHVEYSSSECKPSGIGTSFGNIEPFVGNIGTTHYDFNTLPWIGTPFFPLQPVSNSGAIHNTLTWSGPAPISLYASTSINLNGMILIRLAAPDILNLDCCSGTVYYCFKVRIKDVNCNVCEKIVCTSSPIPKTGINHGSNNQAKGMYQSGPDKKAKPSQQKPDGNNKMFHLLMKKESETTSP